MVEHLTAVGPVTTTAPADGAVVSVPIGWRVSVLSDLRLTEEATTASRALVDGVRRTLEEWSGPGVVVVCGGLFAAGSDPAGSAGGSARRALEAHEPLRAGLSAFNAQPDRRAVLVLSPDERAIAEDPAGAALLAELGVEAVGSLVLDAETGAGHRRLVLRTGPPVPGTKGAVTGATSPVASAPAPSAVGGGGDVGNRPWLVGIDRLERPADSERFVTSRLLYRRLGRYGWWLLVPILAALLLRLPMALSALDHLFANAPGPRHAFTSAHNATWASRLGVAAGITAVEVLVLGAVLALLSRRVWVALGGGRLPPPWSPGDDPPVEVGGWLDEARAAIATGATGLIAGGSLQAELVHLSDGFFARPGGTTEVVREHRGRLGLPPVFLPHLQASSLEIETGADLHVRLVVADAGQRSSTVLERLVGAEGVVDGHKVTAELHPQLVGSWPHGSAWPPPSGRRSEHKRARGARRLAAAAIFVAGLVDLLVALTPPLRAHAHALEHYLPLAVSQAAGALVALAGVGLLMLSRGVLRGQRRTWRVAVGLLAGTAVLHLVRGGDLGSVALSLAVLVLLFIERQHFAAATDRQATRSAAVTVVIGAVLATVLGVVAVEVASGIHREHLPALPSVFLASAERLVGFDTVALPDRIQDFLGPGMLAVGATLFVVCLYFATRPVVDRGLSAGWSTPGRRAVELRARDIVRRHGVATLDYFALRDDKRWYFHRDSLVAYGVYAGVCLVSPDPIGPVSDRAHVWQSFRHHADRHGWGVAVMAAADEWLPIYRESGMHHLYIGDEAVVDVPSFSLQGGKRKGLRQACGRLERYGYRVEMLDPTKVDPELASAIVELMGRQRRGEAERGFSMSLSRVFDPRDTGLLMTVVFGPDGVPAAMCQFVPSPAIAGYSLDLMRRDPGDHPNGLLDYALCSTIEHLKARGMKGLSLNFAAMRSILEGGSGDGLTQRVERWALRRMSGVLPVESLWRFNAKYDPAWLPRYIVWGSAEQFAPALTAILRAEALSEIPVIGRFLTPSSPAPNEATADAAGGAG